MSPKTKNSEPDQSPVVEETKERRRRTRKSGTMTAGQKKSSEDVKKSEKNKRATSARKTTRARKSVHRKTHKAQSRETRSDDALLTTGSAEQTQICEICTTETRPVGEPDLNYKDENSRIAEADRVESRQNHCRTTSEQEQDSVPERSGNSVSEVSQIPRAGESFADSPFEQEDARAPESAETPEQSKKNPSETEAASACVPPVDELKQDSGLRQEAETAASNPGRETSLLPELCRSVWAKALVVLIVLALCSLLPYWWYFKRTVELPQGAAYVDVSIPSGSSGRVIANRISEAGVGVSPDTLIGLLRVQGASLGIHAGRYRFVPGMTLADIVEKLQRGEVEKFSFRVSDGQAIWDLRKAVRLYRTSQ